MAGRLEGKVALVTGAARGMGASHVRAFVREGARIVASDVLDDEGEAVVAELGDRATYLHHDVASEDDWDRVVEATRSRFGRLDVLVNNAGIMILRPLLDTTLEEYRRQVEVNQVGTFLGTRAAGRVMRDGGGGSIVNISSIVGLRGEPAVIGYGATKWAVRGMSKIAAVELARWNIRVNSVHPGGVDTEMVRGVGIDPARYDLNPMGRIGRPEEVSELVVWLGSDASSFCTGAEFAVDGGASA